MDNVNTRSRNLPSEAEQVAVLDIGQCHWKMREVALTPEESTDAMLIAEKRKLCSAATTTIKRVQDRHPDRFYETTTCVVVASNNRLYVGVMIQRVADQGVKPYKVERKAA